MVNLDFGVVKARPYCHHSHIELNFGEKSIIADQDHSFPSPDYFRAVLRGEISPALDGDDEILVGILPPRRTQSHVLIAVRIAGGRAVNAVNHHCHRNGDMNVQLTLSGESSYLAELKNLEDWLLDEPQLSGCPVTRQPATPKPGEMGALSDVLVVALGSGGMGAAFASSLSVWLRSRVADLSIRVRTERGEVEVHARNLHNAEALIGQVIPPAPGSDARPA